MIISRDINELSAKIKPQVFKWLNECVNQKIDVLITCTYRDDAAQEWLYASGRSRKGAILTNARAGQSQHNKRLAVDFCVMTAGKCDWTNAAAFKQVGEIAERYGLDWAGRWSGKLKELGHVEIKS